MFLARTGGNIVYGGLRKSAFVSEFSLSLKSGFCTEIWGSSRNAPYTPDVMCNAMKPVIQSFFCFLILISCDKKNEKIVARNIDVEPILIKIGYYPTFHQPAETIINLKESYLIFYSPTSYSPMPPPPPNKEGKHSKEEEIEYNEFINERPKLNPFKISLTKSEVEEIKIISDSLKSEDFSDRNSTPAFDGMSTNIVVLYSNGNLVQMNPLNGPNEKQRHLYTEILNLLINKNTDKKDSIILQKIKEYR